MLIILLSTLTIEDASIHIIIQVRDGSSILMDRLRGALGIMPFSVILSKVMIVCNLE